MTAATLSRDDMRALLVTVSAVHPKQAVTPSIVETWHDLLAACRVTAAEAGGAMRTLLTIPGADEPPKPGDVLRIVREARARVAPPERPDPSATIPIADVARTILGELDRRVAPDHTRGVRGQPLRAASQSRPTPSPVATAAPQASGAAPPRAGAHAPHAAPRPAQPPTPR